MKESAQKVKKRAREGDGPDRGTMGGQQMRLIVVTPLICTRWRCVAMGERGERGRKSEKGNLRKTEREREKVNGGRQ